MSARGIEPEFYVVEEGMANPRTGEVGWRHWGVYADKAEALKHAKHLPIARLLECRLAWISPGVRQKELSR